MACCSKRLPLASVCIAAALALAACDVDTVPAPDDGNAGEDDGNPDEGTPDMGTAEYENCEEIGTARPCDDDAGMQFCDTLWIDDGHHLAWGECLHSYECMPGDTSDCFESTRSCQLEEGVPYWPECPFTPLLLSFDGGPVELAASTASFDIAGVGECLDSDWPAAANPWLAIDLDKNGFIDAGHELFGSGSILASGRHATQGFAALAQLDSNRDGVIDAGDERFDELLLWRDEDADKLSMAWELSTLRTEGIERIELDYSIREHCDARGNCGRERSRFEFVSAGRRRVGEVVDVYLACP